MAEPTCSDEEGRWGDVFEWEIRGAGEEEVWAVMGDFLGLDKWAPKVIPSCELVEGVPQKPGCVRKCAVYPEPYTFFVEKLLSMDERLHHYTYSIVEGTTVPGFCLLQDYVGNVRLSPLQGQKGTLLRWGYACRPISALTQEQTHTLAFSIFQAGVGALKERLSLPDDSITLIPKS